MSHFLGAKTCAFSQVSSLSMGVHGTLRYLKDDRTGQNKHELLQYSIRTINNSKVSCITYPRKMHALYEKRV